MRMWMWAPELAVPPVQWSHRPRRGSLELTLGSAPAGSGSGTRSLRCGARLCLPRPVRRLRGRRERVPGEPPGPIAAAPALSTRVWLSLSFGSQWATSWPSDGSFCHAWAEASVLGSRQALRSCLGSLLQLKLIGLCLEMAVLWLHRWASCL